jgi:hypothetical protein
MKNPEYPPINGSFLEIFDYKILELDSSENPRTSLKLNKEIQGWCNETNIKPVAWLAKSLCKGWVKMILSFKNDADMIVFKLKWYEHFHDLT